ncbi:MAG: hypothetical protein M3Y74_07170, partial [Chloroflexota bacterium]|nr:hypothetical protein [Chloroflexota bacterium]
CWTAPPISTARGRCQGERERIRVRGRIEPMRAQPPFAHHQCLASRLFGAPYNEGNTYLMAY